MNEILIWGMKKGQIPHVEREKREKKRANNKKYYNKFNPIKLYLMHYY